MTCKGHTPSPLPFLLYFFLLSLSPYPHPCHLLGAGRGRAACLSSGCSSSRLRGWPRPGSPSELRAGLLLAPIQWGQPGEGHASGKAARGWEVAGPALLLDTRVPPLPVPPPEPQPGVRPFGPSGWRPPLPGLWKEAPRHLGGCLDPALSPTGQSPQQVPAPGS